MKTRKYRILFPLILFIFISLSLSCNLAGLPSGSEALPEDIEAAILEEVAGEGDPIQMNIEAGFSRQNPIRLNTLVSVPGWDIQVLECQRGEAAAAIVNSGTRQFDPPPAGYEFALAKVFLRNTTLDEGSHSLGSYDLYITGSNHRGYYDRIDGWPAPEFLFEDMYAAEAVEGWIDVVIPADETDLMLVLDLQPYTEDRITRYFELEPSAAIQPTGPLFDQSPNDLGVDPDLPAGIGQLVILPEWDITVKEALRGDAAMAKLTQADPDFSGPDPGEEFTLLNVNIHYFGTDDLPVSVHAGNFYALANDNRENGNARYPRKGDIVWINGNYFPGATVEGWVIIAYPQGLQNFVIAFDPGEYNWDYVPEEVRFFSSP